MDVKIEESWKALLQEEFDKPYFAELIAFVKNEYAQTRIFPPGKLIFNAFNHCTVDNTESRYPRPGSLPRSRTGARPCFSGARRYRATAFPAKYI